MPLIAPRLIHPQPVIVTQLDQTTTPWDRHYREPATNAWPETGGGGGAPIDPARALPNYGAPVSLQAQVSYKKTKIAEATKDGDAPKGDGYLLFKADALTELGVELRKGDLCIQVNDFGVDYYFVDIVPVGHYGRPHFVKAVFIRRKLGIAAKVRGGLDG